MLIFLFSACKDNETASEPITWLSETVDFSMMEQGEEVEKTQGFQTREVKFRFNDENGKPIRSNLAGKTWYGDSLDYELIKSDADVYANPDNLFDVMEKECNQTKKCKTNFDEAGFVTKEFRVGTASIVEFEFLTGNGAKFKFEIPDDPTAQTFEVTIRRASLGLRLARESNQTATTTQSAFFGFRNAGGQAFKADFKLSAWYFDKSLSENDILGKQARGEIGAPELVASSKLRSFLPNCEIRRILKFNKKAIVQFSFLQRGTNQTISFNRVIDLPAKKVKGQQFPRFVIDNINFQDLAIGVSCD